MVAGTGRLNDSTGVHEDIYTIMYDCHGNELWVEQFGCYSGQKDVVGGLTTDSLGNAYITGYSYLNGGQTQIITVKYDVSGNEQWVMLYGEPSWHQAYDIAVDNDGNVIITGSLSGSSASTPDFITLMYCEQTSTESRENELISHTGLLQITPSPARGGFTINYNLQNAQGASIEVYDVAGRVISETAVSNQGSGDQQLLLDGFQPGVYFCRLSWDSGYLMKKIAILR